MAKRLFKFIGIIMLYAFILEGCSSAAEPPEVDYAPIDNKAEQQSFQGEVIENGTTLLITPNEDSNEARSSDKISVGLDAATLVDETGESITANELQIGDILVIAYNGVIAESYPAQIDVTKIERVDHNNLLDGYLALIDNIYQEDEGLNSEIDTIALDTSEWINLTDVEKELILNQVKEAYNYEVIEGTYDELAEQGVIDKENLYFPTGVLIKISEMQYDKNKEKITCGISKWRGGLGAIGADEVTAILKEERWSITKEGSWIS